MSCPRFAAVRQESLLTSREPILTNHARLGPQRQENKHQRVTRRNTVGDRRALFRVRDEL